MSLLNNIFQRSHSAQLRYYPEVCNVNGANPLVGDFLKSTECRCIVEIGVYTGHTSTKIAKHLDGEGELHLFDFEDRVKMVEGKLRDMGYENIFPHPNSRCLLDSYNWSLMKQLQKQEKPIFDYVLIDGAHTWNVDALTFFLVDRLLMKGGYIHFDDYEWTIEKSTTLNPAVFPLTREMYTPEQIRMPQVKMVVDLLVKRDHRYREVVKNTIFQKIAD